LCWTHFPAPHFCSSSPSLSLLSRSFPCTFCPVDLGKRAFRLDPFLDLLSEPNSSDLSIRLPPEREISPLPSYRFPFPLVTPPLLTFIFSNLISSSRYPGPSLPRHQRSFLQMRSVYLLALNPSVHSSPAPFENTSPQPRPGLLFLFVARSSPCQGLLRPFAEVRFTVSALQQTCPGSDDPACLCAISPSPSALFSRSPPFLYSLLTADLQVLRSKRGFPLAPLLPCRSPPWPWDFSSPSSFGPIMLLLSLAKFFLLFFAA